MVIVCVPAVADEAAARVVLAPDAGFEIVAGENDAVTPLDSPLTESATGELNPKVAAVCNWTVFDFPRTTVTEIALEVIVNPATLSVTTTVGDGDTPALVPVTVIG